MLLIFYLAINKNCNFFCNSISRKVFLFSLKLFSHQKDALSLNSTESLVAKIFCFRVMIFWKFHLTLFSILYQKVFSNSLVFDVHIFCKYIYVYYCTRWFRYISFEIHSNINNGKLKYLLFCKFFFLCIDNKNDQILRNLKVNLYSILYLLHLSDEIDFNVGKSRTDILYWWLSLELLKK